MRDARATTAFEHVAESHNIGVDVLLGMVDRISDASLRSEMDDDLKAIRREQSRHRVAIDDVEAFERKALAAGQAREPRLLERHLVVVVQVIHADYCAAARKQTVRERSTDETGGPSDQYLQRSQRRR